MNKWKLIMASTLALAASFAAANEDAILSIEGQAIPVRASVQSHTPELDEIRSGWTFRISETQDLQRDDFDNPAFVFVDQPNAKLI